MKVVYFERLALGACLLLDTAQASINMQKPLVIFCGA
ncbi:hypothetical protein J2X66_002835 [Pseudomonas sp. 3296]|nr:hypothetical protein [Pseudomonas sp. 3296]